jgi:hypothetical protein
MFNAQVGQRVGFYRSGRHVTTGTGFGTVSKINGHGHITVDVEGTGGAGVGPVQITFTKHGDERVLGHVSNGRRLMDADALQRMLNREGLARRASRAVHTLEEAVKACPRNGMGDVFVRADWLVKVERATSALRAVQAECQAVGMLD